MFNRNVFFAGVLVLFASLQNSAYAYDALEACRGNANLPSEINDCMDNYLDLLDQNLSDLTLFIDRELRGDERAAFSRAQNAFYSYRRENCLWYLSLGGVAIESEQVAKNCLAEMSQERLAELQGLIASYQTPGTENLPEDLLVDPTIDTTDQAEALALAQEPVRSVADDAPLEATRTVDTSNDVDDSGLSAYLGQWQVICTNEDSSKLCTIDVPLESLDAEPGEAVMRVTRSSGQGSGVELRFPDQAIASADNVLWRVDGYAFGAVPGSVISEQEGVTRQIIDEARYLQEDLLPLFREGSQVGITVVEKPGESSGEEFSATLEGFSRALTFADEYISGELQ